MNNNITAHIHQTKTQPQQQHKNKNKTTQHTQTCNIVNETCHIVTFKHESHAQLDHTTKPTTKQVMQCLQHHNKTPPPNTNTQH